MRIPNDYGVRDTDLTHLVVASDLRSVKNAEERILSALARHGYDEESTFAIKLALEEALTNGVKHGNANDPNKRIAVHFFVDDRRVIIGVGDQGPGFRPDLVPDPTADENLERPNGRGIMLMHAYMTRVSYNDCGNEVWMLKEKPNTR